MKETKKILTQELKSKRWIPGKGDLTGTELGKKLLAKYGYKQNKTIT